jgi:hypothetical protein
LCQTRLTQESRAENLNAGLAQQTGEAMLSMLPEVATLTPGKPHASEQFVYRCN